MPSPGQSALKFLRSNLRRGAKPKVRIAVLGQASVGKTALIVRYITRRFIYDYAPEIAKVYQHQTVLDQEDVNMDIWDTAGHFQSTAEPRHLEVFVRWADVVVLVYSITDRASFNLVVQLMEQVASMRQTNQAKSSGKLQPGYPKTNGFLSDVNNGKNLGTGCTSPTSSSAGMKPSSEFCDNCPDFPMLLIGTKCDLWRDRQISAQIANDYCQRLGCVQFKEISTKESLEEVKGVFELALRKGWLFRQHRELTKHKALTLYSSNSAAGLEKSSSLDSSNLDWLEFQTNLVPPSPLSLNPSPSPTERKFSLQPSGSGTVTVGTNSIGGGATGGAFDGARKKGATLSPSSAKCQTILSSIKKCITPAGRPLFNSLPTQSPTFLLGASMDRSPTSGRSDSGLSGRGSNGRRHPRYNSAGDYEEDELDMTDEDIVADCNNDDDEEIGKVMGGFRGGRGGGGGGGGGFGPKRFFRSRSNTDSKVVTRHRSLSFGSNLSSFASGASGQQNQNQTNELKPKRKGSVFQFP